MKKQLRTKSCLVFALLLLVMSFSVTSCGEPESTVEVYEPLYLDNVTESVVADDGINQLVWDVNEKAVFFYNTYTGRIWSSIPYDFYLQQQDKSLSTSESSRCALEIKHHPFPWRTLSGRKAGRWRPLLVTEWLCFSPSD